MTPGYENILGAALATNSVTVNGGLADRKGEYFHREISVANTGQPVWQNVTNISGSFTNKGGLLVPASSQVLTYDADGNLSSDSIWTYQWDAENRLISMTMTNNVAWIANSNRLKLDFAYDYMGRRVQKIVSVWNASTNNYLPSTTSRFVYDGWNLLAIINPQSSILQSFMWGKDLSGTLTKAGGVGGLLMASISGTNCFAAYDGNGNITALINACDKSLTARYEYSPYGELVRSTGSLAKQNPFQYFTKYYDIEGGLIYYGYRYYSPSLGRWISRDSTGEKGGLHLYAFLQNSPFDRVDNLGQDGDLISTLWAGAVSVGCGYVDLFSMFAEFGAYAFNTTAAYACAYTETASLWLTAGRSANFIYVAGTVTLGYTFGGSGQGVGDYTSTTAYTVGDLLSTMKESEEEGRTEYGSAIMQGMADAWVDTITDPDD